MVLLSTVGCGAGGPARRGTQRYALTDSATAACQRNPAYCAKAVGEEAVVSLGGRAVQVAATGKAWQVLDAVATQGIEDILVECARWADAEVNQQEFGGRHPTADECKQQVGARGRTP